MRLKTVIATILSTAMAVCILAAPSAELQTKAAVKGAGVYTNNQATGIPGVNIQTPEETVKLYARLSWALLEEGVGVRLNVTDSGCGPVAKRSGNVYRKGRLDRGHTGDKRQDQSMYRAPGGQ